MTTALQLNQFSLIHIQRTHSTILGKDTIVFKSPVKHYVDQILQVDADILLTKPTFQHFPRFFFSFF